MADVMKKCPYCAEEIKAQALICKHCKSTLEEDSTAPTHPLPSFLVRIKNLVFGQTSITDLKDRTISDYILNRRREKTLTSSYDIQNMQEEARKNQKN